MQWVLIVLGCAILAVLGVCVVRTIICGKRKPVCTLEQKTDARALRYGDKLAKLIRCETVSSKDDPSRDKFYKFQDLIAEEFPHLHAACEKHDFNGSLLYKWKGGPGQPIMLMAHMDVVAAADGWEHPPFAGEVVDGVVWGRGTLDTKGTLFSILQSVDEMIEAGVTPSCDVYIASSCSEEYGGEGGPMTAAFLKENGVQLKFLIDEGGVILHEPVPGADGVFAMIGVLEKGCADVHFVARGNGGHSSVPKKNDTVARLAKFVLAIEKKSPFKGEIYPALAEMLRRIAPTMKFSTRFFYANLWLFKPLLERVLPEVNPNFSAMSRNTIAFTRMQGSNGNNILPQEAWVNANIRLLGNSDPAESVAKVAAVAKKFGVEPEYDHATAGSPVTSSECDSFKLVEQAISEQFGGIQAIPYPVLGGTDSRNYVDVCDNIIRFCPLYVNRQQFNAPHGMNENLNASALPDAVDFYKKLIAKLNG